MLASSYSMVGGGRMWKIWGDTGDIKKLKCWIQNRCEVEKRADSVNMKENSQELKIFIKVAL